MCTSRAADLLAARDGNAQSTRLEHAQRVFQRRRLRLRDFEMDHARELAGEVGHAALGPVRAGAAARIGDRLDDSGLVRADGGEHEGNGHGRTPLRVYLDGGRIVRRKLHDIANLFQWHAADIHGFYRRVERKATAFVEPAGALVLRQDP